MLNIDSFNEVSHKNGEKLPKFTNLTLKYDLLTMKMTPGVVENVPSELTVLRNPYLDPEIVSLALLEVNLAQDSSYSFRLKLQTTSIGGFRQ